MAQKIFGLAIGGSGIVAVLIIAGILLATLTSNKDAGNIAMWAGIAIGIALGILGVFGVLISLLKRIG